MTDVKSDTITITVDGKPVECRPGELVIEVAKRAGVYIPFFCYHPRMEPVGACRMCLVHMTPGPPKPQTACTTRVTDGMTIETQFTNAGIREAQSGVLEFLLINHPLDCPICDRAGECPLQDQTQDYGPTESRYVENKRRFEKPVAISPLINLDRERCILCYRCTRFCEELSGDVLIGVMERGPHAYIFPFEGESFDSYFSGNTVQICPVGALTSTEYRFSARPWDLQVVPTTCNMCAAGCAIHANVRVQDGKLARFSAAVNEETNEEWLCDKGRYGNAYISSQERLTYPYARKGGELVPVSWNEAFDLLAEGLKPVLDGGASGMIVGESLCDEDYYVAQKFARLVLGTHNIDHRLEGGLEADGLVRPDVTYDDLLASDLVVLVECDVREELPVLFLRMRIAATKRGLPIAIVHPREIALSEYAVAHVQSDSGAVPAALSASEQDDEVRKLADALKGASNPIIVLGSRAHHANTVNAWRAAADATGARLTWAPRRSGTYGALASGAHPELLPGWHQLDTSGRHHVEGIWGTSLPEGRGLDVGGMLNAAASGELKALWLVGADVLTDVPDKDLGRRALESTPFVVVSDVQSTQALNHAHLVLPAASFVERKGTTTDWEGRRQQINPAVDPPGAARADYAIIAEVAHRLGKPIGCRSYADAKAELDAILASPASIEAAPAAEASTVPADDRLRLLTYRLLYDEGSRIAHTEGVSKLTPEAFAEINVADAERLGIADGATINVSSPNGTITVAARVTKAIRSGVVFVPYNQPGAKAQALLTWDDRWPTLVVEPT